jgi:predicted nucleotidyltransferase
MTVERTGGAHDSGSGYSASALRKRLLHGAIPLELMTGPSVAASMEEIVSGRGPVSIKNAELAVLSRLRALDGFAGVQGTPEGLERRFMRYAAYEASISAILARVKTKRYTMARLRRMLMCFTLGIGPDDTVSPPPYARVLAFNDTGKA